MNTKILLFFSLGLVGSQTIFSNIYDSIEQGDLTTVRFLIENKRVDINHRNGKNYPSTPLLYATLFNQVKIVEYLLQKGANPNAYESTFDEDYDSFDENDKANQTTLYWACLKGHNKIAKMLLEHGAKVNFKKYYGKGPLEVVKGNNVELIKLLKKYHDMQKN